jgi:hypothetical protein
MMLYGVYVVLSNQGRLKGREGYSPLTLPSTSFTYSRINILLMIDLAKLLRQLDYMRMGR